MSSLSLNRLRAKGRRLVPFLPPKAISPVGAKEQSTPLLARLPPELRWLIWDLYFGKYMVHCHVVDERLRAKQCTTGLVDGDESIDYHLETCGRGCAQCHYIPLLLACKKIYFECIDTLYRKTCFDFSTAPGALSWIPKRLPARHVNLISRVTISYMLYWPIYLNAKKPDRGSRLWVGTWEALAAMEGLEWLRYMVAISMPHMAPEYSGLEGTLLEHVRKVTAPSHFELILPWPAAEETREETLPCIVIRRVGDPGRPPVSGDV